jgi:glyoxalase family protein
MQSRLLGIHHVTAICGDAQENVDFYAGVLGLRLVKQTVNYDDSGAYHLYYGDAMGRPGTLLTFFSYPDGQPGRMGPGRANLISLRVRKDALDYWQNRLEGLGVRTEASPEMLGEWSLRTYDPDGLPLELVEIPDDPTENRLPGPIPDAFAIRGVCGVTICERQADATSRFLMEVLELGAASLLETRLRFQMGTSRIDVVCRPDEPAGRSGRGTIHHVAFRTPNPYIQEQWLKTLLDHRCNVSPVMDRTYFKSIYFGEPGGALFEIATDGPGMSVDESADHLGETLKLPASQEEFRASLESALPRLRLPKDCLT